MRIFAKKKTAYQLTKRPLFEDVLELCDSAGAVTRTIYLSLDLDDLLGQYDACCTAIKKAELLISQNPGDAPLEAYGFAVMDLLRLVFGDNAEVILSHYDGHYTAMLETVMPYLRDVIGPKLREVSRSRLDAMNQERK